jgi:hypothetical protein
LKNEKLTHWKHPGEKLLCFLEVGDLVAQSSNHRCDETLIVLAHSTSLDRIPIKLGSPPPIWARECSSFLVIDLFSSACTFGPHPLADHATKHGSSAILKVDPPKV